MWSGIDRRRFPRARYKCLIALRKKGSTKKLSTYTENIGAGGICVIIDEDLGLFQGTEIELDLGKKETGVIKCSGTVVWVIKKRDLKQKGGPKYDTGIEFVDIDEAGRDAIAGLVESILKKS